MMESLHRNWPLIRIALVMYATAIGTLWAAVHSLSTGKQPFSPLRGLIAAVVMTVAGNVLGNYLSPVLGSWHIAVKMLLDVLVVKLCFSLSVWRSILVTLIYFAMLTGVYYIYIHFSGLPS